MKIIYAQGKKFQTVKSKMTQLPSEVLVKGCDLRGDHINNSSYVIFLKRSEKRVPPKIVPLVHVVYILGHAFHLQGRWGKCQHGNCDLLVHYGKREKPEEKLINNDFLTLYLALAGWLPMQALV